jgi:hypothetical protein
MKTYWNIVPTDDGYSYIGFAEGKHIKYNKGGRTLNTSLLFKTKDECIEYIRNNLNPDKYKEETIWINEKYYGLD